MNIFRQSQRLVFSCIDQPQSIVVSELVRYLNAPSAPSAIPLPQGTGVSDPFAEKAAELSFQAVNNGVSQAKATTRKCVLWTPKANPGVTAFLNNLDDGMEFNLDRLSRKVPWRVVTTVLFDDPKNEFPACAISCYHNFQETKRRIAAMKEIDGWLFHTEGPLLSFENPEYYERRLVRDRLNRNIIASYLTALGYDVADDRFWETDQLATFIWQR
jgi:hypothetical protein